MNYQKNKEKSDILDYLVKKHDRNHLQDFLNQIAIIKQFRKEQKKKNQPTTRGIK